MPRMRFIVNPASRRRPTARYYPQVAPAYGRFEGKIAPDWLPVRPAHSRPKTVPRGATAKLQCARQVEYYLSESFLPYDQPLWERYWDAQADHWVPLAVLAGYAELRPYRDAYDTPWIADALLQSTSLELDRSGLRVRRRKALGSNTVLSDAFERTLYIAGFPTSPPPRPGSLKAFFGKIAPVRVQRRRDIYTGQFDGSVFVEFAERSELEDFMVSCPAWHGHNLEVMTKEAFCALKVKEWGFSSSTVAKLRSRLQCCTTRAFIPPQRRRQEDDDLNEVFMGQPRTRPAVRLTVKKVVAEDVDPALLALAMSDGDARPSTPPPQSGPPLVESTSRAIHANGRASAVPCGIAAFPYVSRGWSESLSSSPSRRALRV